MVWQENLENDFRVHLVYPSLSAYSLGEMIEDIPESSDEPLNALASSHDPDPSSEPPQTPSQHDIQLLILFHIQLSPIRPSSMLRE